MSYRCGHRELRLRRHRQPPELHQLAGTQAYTYPSTSHRLSQIGATVRSYDNAGNTTAIGGTAKEFVYDDTGRMSQVKQNAIVQRNYAYNGKGEAP